MTDECRKMIKNHLDKLKEDTEHLEKTFREDSIINNDGDGFSTYIEHDRYTSLMIALNLCEDWLKTAYREALKDG